MKRNCLKHGLKFTRFNFLIHYFIELPLHVANINQLLKILELKSEQGKKQKNSRVCLNTKQNLHLNTNFYMFQSLFSVSTWLHVTCMHEKFFLD